jgi:hypothetical protein
MEMQEMGSILELSGDKTNDFLVRNSIEYASEHQHNELNEIVDLEHYKKYDMRNSHKFVVD